MEIGLAGRQRRLAANVVVELGLGGRGDSAARR